MSGLEEKEFRVLAGDTQERVQKKLEDVDPDLIEADFSQGALTLLCQGNKKIIVSLQPPVRQLWLAAAHLGIAVHFNWDAGQKAWVDDKGHGQEFYTFLSDTLEKATGLRVKF